MRGLVSFHEPKLRRGVDPVSSANQAAALARISFSSRRIRHSRRSRRSSSRSAVVRPSLRPSSISDWFTQLRIVWSDGSNSRLSSPGVRPDLTRPTISARIRENPLQQQKRRATDPSELTPPNPVTIRASTEAGQPESLRDSRGGSADPNTSRHTPNPSNTPEPTLQPPKWFTRTSQDPQPPTGNPRNQSVD